jgi:hypothetical protein
VDLEQQKSEKSAREAERQEQEINKVRQDLTGGK